MKIYATLLVPEIWRFDGEAHQVYLLSVNGKYKKSSTRQAFPLHELERFLKECSTTDETTVLLAFRQWERETIVP